MAFSGWFVDIDFLNCAGVSCARLEWGRTFELTPELLDQDFRIDPILKPLHRETAPKRVAVCLLAVSRVALVGVGR